MRGHIRERSSGHWAIVLEVPDDASGKRKRRWHSFKGTKRQAQDECARLITELKNGNAIEPNKATVTQFLGRWLDHVKTQVTPKSHERYAGLVNQNLIPALGGHQVNKLKPIHISAAYTAALEGGRKDGKAGGLSPRTVGHMHRVLKQALGQAVKWKELTHNPADAVDPPKIEWKPVQTYDLSQSVEVIDALRGTPLFIPTLLALLCGLRRGEICALRWGRVDLDGANLSIVAWSRRKPVCASSHLRAARGETWPCLSASLTNCAPIGSNAPKICCGLVRGSLTSIW